ncbi:MAG: ATP-binding protein, partial [Betaproteobacteria bacterium]
MKPVDINSLLQASASLDEDLLASYLEHYAIDVKAAELSDLKNLASMLQSSGAKIGDLADFYVGYKIPQIGKEFDLLRFGESSVLNIELKSESSTEKIRTQLLRNRYYLSFLGLAIDAFTFESSSSIVYYLNDDGELETSDAATLLAKIVKQTLDTDSVPDRLFNPSDFLVSPFNSTNKFLADEYFLTHQQEDFKNKILNAIATASEASFIAITGSAGTGKTLLTFDVAKHLQREGKKVLVIHCGILNSGHRELAKQGWMIVSVKNHQLHDLSLFDLVILDEAQRIKKSQLDDIAARVTSGK